MVSSGVQIVRTEASACAFVCAFAFQNAQSSHLAFEHGCLHRTSVAAPGQCSSLVPNSLSLSLSLSLSMNTPISTTTYKVRGLLQSYALNAHDFRVYRHTTSSLWCFTSARTARAVANARGHGQVPVCARTAWIGHVFDTILRSTCSGQHTGLRPPR